MLTADGVPVLIHDETLDRTTSMTGKVADTLFATLRAEAPGVPALAEAIDTCHRLKLWANIELKPSTGLEADTGEIVGRWLVEHWDGKGVISSFSQKSALAARRHLPAAHFALLFDSLPNDWRACCNRIGAMAVHLDAACVDTRTATELAGVPWAAYTVNTVETAQHLFALGCAAIFTDRPDLWLPGSA